MNVAIVITAVICMTIVIISIVSMLEAKSSKKQKEDKSQYFYTICKNETDFRETIGSINNMGAEIVAVTAEVITVDIHDDEYGTSISHDTIRTIVYKHKEL